MTGDPRCKNKMKGGDFNYKDKLLCQRLNICSENSMKGLHTHTHIPPHPLSFYWH